MRRAARQRWRLPGRQRGFTLLELGVVVSLIAILAAIAFDRIWGLRVEAERVAVAQVVGAIRSALGIEVARRVLREGVETLAQLDSANPMTLLAQQPAGYRGEWPDAEAGQLEPGEWYFDVGRGVLVYRVRFAEAFESEPRGDRAVYRLVLRYEDRNGNGRFESARETIYGLDLVPAGDFRWKDSPARGRGRYF